jgi:hypothetical protein
MELQADNKLVAADNNKEPVVDIVVDKAADIEADRNNIDFGFAEELELELDFVAEPCIRRIRCLNKRLLSKKSKLRKKI